VWLELHRASIGWWYELDGAVRARSWRITKRGAKRAGKRALHRAVAATV
jgi:hypothetical protein